MEIPSLSHRLRHPPAVFITGTSCQKKKKSFISQCGLFYGLLLELLRVQVFSGSACSRRAKSFFFFQADFQILLGFPPYLPIQRLSYVPAVRAAVCQTLSRSHAASLPYHTAMWVVSPLLNRFLVLLVPPLWPGDCFSKNAGPHTAELWTMNRFVVIKPWTKNKLQIIFLSPRDRGVKALEMQDSVEAIHGQKKHHSCYIHYIKSPFSSTNLSLLLPQNTPHTFNLFPFSLWHELLVQDRNVHGNNHQPCKNSRGRMKERKIGTTMCYLSLYAS